MLEIKNLMVFYENATAINNLSLTCNEGKVTGIFGSNSAGKSTLMYTISGIILDTKKKEEMRGGERISILGEMRFRGEDILDVRPSERAKRGIVLCPERRRIFSESSVMENLKMGAYLRRDKREITKDLENIYEHFPALRTRLGQPAGSLSGGEQQMLATTRALMTSPKLLLMDEPSMGLSPILVGEVGKIIKDINSDGISIILVEQNARMALNIAHYCYVLEVGRIAAQGTGEALSSDEEVKKAYLGS